MERTIKKKKHFLYFSETFQNPLKGEIYLDRINVTIKFMNLASQKAPLSKIVKVDEGQYQDGFLSVWENRASKLFYHYPDTIK